MTNFKIAYSFDSAGNYIGEAIAHRSPLDTEELYLLPAQATFSIPVFEAGKNTIWNGNEWILEDIILPPEPTEEELREIEKQNKIMEYKAIRAAKLAEDFLVNISGTDFVVNHYDLALITSITEHLQEQTGTVSHKWTNANGDSVDLPPIAFSIIREAILEKAQEARHTYNLQVKALNNTTTQTVILNNFEA